MARGRKKDKRGTPSKVIAITKKEWGAVAVHGHRVPAFYGGSFKCRLRSRTPFHSVYV